nr:hypothetical protein GCM10020063_093060 [Dactylosporangium thailandense]
MPVPKTPSASTPSQTRGVSESGDGGRPAMIGAAMTRCSVDMISWPAESWNGEMSKCCISQRV